MSGLCGLVTFDTRPAERATLEAMGEVVAYRGPDGAAYWTDGPVGMGYLAHHFTPESRLERQPLMRGELTLVASVRLDNRDELRSRLSAEGLLNEGDTDADLVMGAYRLWGEGCAERLLGDFAFAVWDARRRRLFAARDPLAMRPFYYRLEPSRVLFASEVKQILAAPGVEPKRNDRLIRAFLLGRYEPLEETFYEGILQLLPAHALVVEDGKARSWRYWDADPAHKLRYRRDEEYAEHFRALFQEAVRCRLRSHKPVGLLLSGGVDSGAIASMGGWLRRQAPDSLAELRTYSWALKSGELASVDERGLSSVIVEHYGLTPTDIWADELLPLKDYPKHGPDQDEPFFSVYQALLERALAVAHGDGVGLMLSGDRGDLLMGDVVYDYAGLFRAGRWRALQAELRELSEWKGMSLAQALRKHVVEPQLAALWPAHRARGLREALKARWRRPASARGHGVPWLQPNALERLEGADKPLPQAWADEPDPMRRLRYLLIFHPMHMRGVATSERTNARAGLGFADPWSDRRLVEFILAIPPWVVTRLVESKRLVREGLRGIVPEEVRGQLGKNSPAPLLEKALRDKARELLRELLADPHAGKAGYLDGRALADHYEAILRGERDHAYFWHALSVEMWLRQHWS